MRERKCGSHNRNDGTSVISFLSKSVGPWCKVAVHISKSNKDGGKRIGYSIPEIPMGDKSKGKRVSTAVLTDNGT